MSRFGVQKRNRITIGKPRMALRDAELKMALAAVMLALIVSSETWPAAS